MKSLKDYSLNLSESEYHEYPAWSYSVIAKYAKDGFSSLKTLHDKTEPTASMEFGSLFDSIMTKGKATLDEYTVLDITVPDAERKALDYIASQTDTPLNEMSSETISAYCNECEYQPRWGADARAKHLLPYEKYYNVKRSGKKIVSQTDWNDAIEMHKVFRNDSYLKTLFGTRNTNEVEYIYQAQYLTEYQLDNDTKVTVKIMPDLLVVNHKEKTVQPVDLKTSTVPGYDFWENFVKFRYDLQAELYSDVLRKLLLEIPGYEDYTLLPYLFTDISRTDKVPVTWDYDPSNGFNYTKGDKFYSYKGWKELLSEILEYEESEAKVPCYISTTGPNNIIDILSR